MEGLPRYRRARAQAPPTEKHTPSAIPSISVEDLVKMTPDQKDEAILRLGATLRVMENHR